MNLLDEIPNLREAIERERVNWNSAFLPVIESINGFDAAPLTLRRYLILRLMNTPLLRGEVPSPDELAAFLWAISPLYQPQGGWRRKRFFRHCRKEWQQPGMFKRLLCFVFRRPVKNNLKAAATIQAAFQYIADSFMDRPGGSSAPGTEYYCDACFICAAFAREFGWDDEITLDKSLKRIFQYLKELRRYHNPKAPLFKPSDRLVADWLEKKNAELTKN